MYNRITCLSVVGGWVSFDVTKNTQFGPTFNKVTDLWKWQAKHLRK